MQRNDSYHSASNKLAARALLIGGANKVAEDRERLERERALLTSKNLKSGWFSLRTHGDFEPCRGTIRNRRAGIRRNRVVSFPDGFVGKFKFHPVNKLPIPHEVTK